MNEFVSKNIITIVAAAFVFEVLMGMLAQSIAQRKGHSKRWFWAGFLLSLMGAIWAAGLPDETLRRQLMNLDGQRKSPDDGAVSAVKQAAAGSAVDGGELAAVLSAAVAAMGGEEGRRFVLRSFRPAGEASTAWNRAGRGRPAQTRK
jgi:hypothetical protein